MLTIYYDREYDSYMCNMDKSYQFNDVFLYRKKNIVEDEIEMTLNFWSNHEIPHRFEIPPEIYLRRKLNKDNKFFIYQNARDPVGQRVIGRRDHTKHLGTLFMPWDYFKFKLTHSSVPVGFRIRHQKYHQSQVQPAMQLFDNTQTYYTEDPELREEAIQAYVKKTRLERQQGQKIKGLERQIQRTKEQYLPDLRALGQAMNRLDPERLIGQEDAKGHISQEVLEIRTEIARRIRLDL